MMRFSFSMRSFRSAAIALQLGIVALLASCGGGGSSSAGTPVMQSIEVTGAGASAVAGTQAQLTATAIYSDFSHKDVTATAVWTSSNPPVASVSAGTITALAPGKTTVSASLAGETGTLAFTVTHATLQSIEVTPARPSVAKGTSLQLAAMGVYSDGTTQDITSQVAWASAAPAVASVNTTGASAGLVTAAALGTTNVIASIGSLNGFTALTVTAAVLQSIQVTPANPTLVAGITQQFTATGIFSDHTTQNLTSQVMWASDTAAVATVSNTLPFIGLASTLAAGTAHITATMGAVVSTAVTLSVSSATLVSIAVTPATPSVALGTTLQFVATGTYTDNSTQVLTSIVTWASDTPSVATVSNAAPTNGIASTHAQGAARITASSGTVISPPVSITVSPASLVSIQVTPATPSIALGSTQQFVATGIYSDSSTQVLTSTVTWGSDNLSVATVSNAPPTNGLASSVSLGMAHITAASGTVVSIPVPLAVTAATLVSIAVTPATPNVALGTAQQFVATGTYSDNSTQVLTNMVTWASDTPSVASVSNASPSYGLASTFAQGTAHITATSGAVISPSVTLTVSPATLVSIAVTPATPSVALGTTQQLVATGTYSNNSTQVLTGTVTWTSDLPSVATVSNASPTNGLASTHAQGTTHITATSGGILSPAITLTVTAATLVSIEVTPATPSIALGTTQQFVATGVYSDNSTQGLTSAVSWASDSHTVATVSNASPTYGLATALATGTAHITATSGTVVSPAVTLTVTAATLVSIAVTPASPSVALGTTQQFVATGTYTDNSTQILTSTATWASDDHTVATVSNASPTFGLASALATGTAHITASSGTVVSPAVTLTVTGATLVSIAVAPASSSVALGTTQQFVATGTYTNGSTQNLTSTATWASDNHTVATVSNASPTFGLASTLATGTAHITATSGTVVSPAVLLTVTP